MRELVARRVLVVHRRIGGLEMLLQALRERFAVHRRIGGLENLSW